MTLVDSSAVSRREMRARSSASVDLAVASASEGVGSESPPSPSALPALRGPPGAK